MSMIDMCVIGGYLLGLPIAAYIAGKVGAASELVLFWPLVAVVMVAIGILYPPVRGMIYLYDLGKSPKKARKAKAKAQEVK